jgi:putative transposase
VENFASALRLGTDLICLLVDFRSDFRAGWGMTRYARFHVTGGLFHVISRFHDRRFYLDIDGAREKYLELLGRATKTHDSRIIAYCLMSSHVHIVLQLGNDPLGQLAKRINAPFGNWINKQRKGLGPILADRPRSVLIHSETHGMELIRYVHNNPVRAGLVKRASQSEWSSHRAYLGLEKPPPWLAVEAVLGPNEKNKESIRRDLAAYVDEGRFEERRPEFSGEISKELSRRVRKLMGGDLELSYPVLGPDSFLVSALKEQAARHDSLQAPRSREIGIEKILRRVFGALKLDPDLARKRVKPVDVARARALVAWVWVERMGRPQAMAAQGIGVRPCAVTRMLTKLRRERLTKEEEQLVEDVLVELIDADDDRKLDDGDKTDESEVSPKVAVLRRRRG